MILVGSVTFDAWPRAASLIGGGGGKVSIGTAPTSAPVAAPSQVPNLVKLLGSGGGRVTIWKPRSEQGSAGQAPRAQGTQVSPEGGSTGGQEPVQASPPPSQGPSEPEPRTIVGQTVSSTGDTVEATTDSVGDALGGSDNQGLGGTVANLGETLNGTLQGLAGSL